MAVSLVSTGITFPDGTTQTTAAGAGGFSNMQVFTSSGTFTVPAGVTKVKVTVQGGGGGSPWSSYNAGSGSGNAGGTSSFGAYISATGGSGTRTGTPAYTNGGTASGGSFTVNGFIGDTVAAGGARGADSLYGTGAYPISYKNTANSPLTYSRRNTQGYGSGVVDVYGYGGGGGGAFSQGVFTVTPGAAITVTVGAAGTSASNGGSGAQGFVIVEY